MSAIRLAIAFLVLAPVAAASTADQHGLETYLLPVYTRGFPTIGFTDAGDRGRLSYVRRDVAHLLDMKLRLADLSRHAVDAGTEIPVVRSGQFHTSTLRLLNVPLSEDNRVMLRIFDVDDTGDAASVEIRIHSLSGTLLHSETRAFTASGYLPADGLPFAPSYIEIPLTVRSESVRIDIVPLTPELRFWAYASITNNLTQHVTLVTPP